MLNAVVASGRFRLPALTVVVLAAALLVGCPRVLYLDYRPSTSLKGQGPVQVAAFTYAGHPTGLVKRREVETGSKDFEVLYLSQDISVFFASAVKGELSRAGYNVRPDTPRTVSGTIEHFFLDYAGEDEQLFQIRVSFSVVRPDAQLYHAACNHNRQQVKDWMKSGLIIEQGVRACIDQFLQDAQAAGAL